MNADLIVLAAGLSFICGYLIINQVFLRIFVLIGTLFYIWYYAVAADAPLWSAMLASVAMGLANVIGLCGLFISRSRFMVPYAHRDIYPTFGALPPGHFRRLIKLAKRVRVPDATQLCSEGEPLDRLYFILNGGLDVTKKGTYFSLPSGMFVGEVAYLLGRDSAADVIAKAGTEYLVWDSEVLHKAASGKPNFKMALEAMISRDLARKVAEAVSPDHIGAAQQNGQDTVWP